MRRFAQLLPVVLKNRTVRELSGIQWSEAFRQVSWCVYFGEFFSNEKVTVLLILLLIFL